MSTGGCCTPTDPGYRPSERVQKGCREDSRNLIALFTPAKLLVHLFFFFTLNVIPTAMEVECCQTRMHCWSGLHDFNRVRPMPDPPKWVIA